MAGGGTMRCYFFKEGRIEGVELLKQGSDDDLIRQAKLLYQERTTIQAFDGFEIWSGRRFIYRSPAPDIAPRPPSFPAT